MTARRPHLQPRKGRSQFPRGPSFFVPPSRERESSARLASSATTEMGTHDARPRWGADADADAGQVVVVENVVEVEEEEREKDAATDRCVPHQSDGLPDLGGGRESQSQGVWRVTERLDCLTVGSGGGCGSLGSHLCTASRRLRPAQWLQLPPIASTVAGDDRLVLRPIMRAAAGLSHSTSPYPPGGQE
jgi:hypothetical protein